MDVRQTQQPCNAETIERFLADRLSAAEAADFEDHLDACPACRRELEARAADEDWWSAARDCLAPSAESPSSRDASLANSSPAAVTQSWPQTAESPAGGPSLLDAVNVFLNPTDDPRMLGRVGNYEVAGIIGSGGNGVVLKGFDPALSRNVAIKLLSPRLADSGAARRRFSREAQAAAAVVHDNVLAIHAVSETHGLPYLVMPYMRGPSLETRLRTSGPLALEEVLRVGRQVAAGLAAAHAQGLVHRDIKPANILLEEGVERVKITDFGLARAADDASLTRSGVIAGTPQYMSPEQARGEPIDHRADLFSLGCVLYAGCAGRSPFRAETSYGVLRKICEDEPHELRDLNPAVPLWLVRLIGRLLAKEPSQRFGSAAEVAALLEQCLAHIQQPATIALPDELIESGRRKLSTRTAAAGFVTWLGRHRVVTTTAVVLLLLAGGIAAWAWQTTRQREGQNADRQGPATAPVAARAAPADQDVPWNDNIDQSITELSADVERLRAEGAVDLWNDSLSARIERLESDVDELRAQATESNPPTSLQENQP